MKRCIQCGGRKFSVSKKHVPFGGVARVEATVSTCTQCKEAWCLAACPSAAISRVAESGVVQVDDNRCVGCKMCTLACPFGVIAYNPSTGKAIKCDHCDGTPVCVQMCPTGALAYEDEQRPARSKRSEVARKLADAVKEVRS